MRYLISYDIPETRRRTRIAKILLDFGQRIQYSVFEAELSDDLYQKMRSRILWQLDEKKDKLMIFRICRNCLAEKEEFGEGQAFEKQDFFIV